MVPGQEFTYMTTGRGKSEHPERGMVPGQFTYMTTGRESLSILKEGWFLARRSFT